MMRDLHLGFRLDFSTLKDQEDSEQILLRILGVNSLLNLMYLRKHPETKSLYDSGVVYTPPDQADGRPTLKKKDLKDLLALVRKMGADPETALMIVRMLRGIEIFLDIPTLYRRGKGDCNELVPVRIAELWRAGIAASPYLTKQEKPDGGIAYHATILHPDNSAEDSSLILGMSGLSRNDERREEIRKNAERISNYLAAGADPHQVAMMGFFPSDGVFRSPYTGALQ